MFHYAGVKKPTAETTTSSRKLYVQSSILRNVLVPEWGQIHRSKSGQEADQLECFDYLRMSRSAMKSAMIVFASTISPRSIIRNPS